MPDALRWMPMRGWLGSRRQLVWVLLIALLWVQSVGVLHRVVHATLNGGGSLQVSVSSSRIGAALWGEHSTSVDCQLFDQACPDLGYREATVQTPVVMPSFWGLAVFQERFALVERFYAARGPPVVH